VSGPKSTGRVFLEAIKKDGVWSLTRLTLTIDGRDGEIDLLKQSKAEIGGAGSRIGAMSERHVHAIALEERI